MDAAEFRKRGKEMVDYIADYLDSVHHRRVFPEVDPGYLDQLIPTEAPEEGENWDEIIKVDSRRCIWQLGYIFEASSALSLNFPILGIL